MASSTDIQVLYQKLTKVADGLGKDAVSTLRLALNTAEKRPPVITQETAPEIKEEPNSDSDSEGGSNQPSTSGVNNGLTPGQKAGYGPAPNVGFTKNLGFTAALGPDDIPAPPPHPTDPEEIRKLMRSKMHRCLKCKNRFVERNLLERHLHDKHYEQWIVYMEEQAREMEEQRLAEMEQSRREEILSGGFIPPEGEIDSYINVTKDPNQRPTGTEPVSAQHRWGGLKLPPRKFPYKKKISPQCPFCDKRFRNENSLKKHIAKKHPLFINFVQCNRCYKSLPSADDLKEGGHDCELNHVCFQCEPMRNMCTAERLLSHRSKFHRGKNSGFRCNICQMKCLTPRKLRKHKKMTHVVTKPFKCHFCDEYFPTDTQVSLHERIHTGKVKYECTVCDFRANRWAKLDKHKRLEHGYLCSICHEKLREWSELKYHTLERHGGYLSSESQAVSIESPRVWVLFKGE